MYRLRRSRLLVAFLSLSLLYAPLPVAAVADEPQAKTQTTGSLSSSLDRARELIQDGKYDDAILILKPSIARARTHPDSLKNAYLLLIKSHVYLGTMFRVQPQGLTASNLNYDEAKRLITELLKVKELRHTRPEPAPESPPEMIGFFSDVRSQIFGSFRVTRLEPSGAVVLLDTDTLRTLPGDSLLGDVDIAVGPHTIVARAKGYKDLTEEIQILPSSTVERPYRLQRRRGAAWYATLGAGAIGVVGGIVALVAAGGGPTPAPEPLPPAPPPPSQ